MKFKYIPKWSTYIAQDRNGKWYAFENRPNLNEGEWICDGRREEVYPELITTLGAIKGKW